MPLLELQQVSVGYSRTPVLSNVGVSLHQGEIVTLIGANGAGKSSLAKLISGVLKPLTGDILVDGRSITGTSASARLRMGIAHVPEGRQIFSGMTVKENLVLGAYSSPNDVEGVKERISFVCCLFPVLKERLNEVAGNFSGGQQQMLAIARGLMSKPRILILDEPSLGVAPLLLPRFLERSRDFVMKVSVFFSSNKMRGRLFLSPTADMFLRMELSPVLARLVNLRRPPVLLNAISALGMGLQYLLKGATR